MTLYYNMESLLKGDCLKIMPDLPEHSVHAIITDLPYGTTNCKWDSLIPLTDLWRAYDRVLKPQGPVILFSTQPFTTTLIASNLKMFKYCWYWLKEKGTGFLNAKKQPMRMIEEVCVFSSGVHLYHPQMMPRDKPYKHTLPVKRSEINKGGVKSIESMSEEREYAVYTHAYPTNVIRFPRDNANKSLIPTQKPLALVEYMVKTYTNQGDTVLDSCMGSGTTGVACRNLQRNFVGIELDEKHFEIARNRLSISHECRDEHLEDDESGICN